MDTKPLKSSSCGLTCSLVSASVYDSGCGTRVERPPSRQPPIARLLLLRRLLLPLPRRLILADVDPRAVLLQRVAAVGIVDPLAPLPGLGLLVGAVAEVERVLLRAMSAPVFTMLFAASCTKLNSWRIASMAADSVPTPGSSAMAAPFRQVSSGVI